MIITIIIVMFFLIFNIITFCVAVKDESIYIYSDDNLLEKICKIYSWIVVVSIALFILYVISYAIAKPIWCDISNNDNKICEKVDVKNDE